MKKEISKLVIEKEGEPMTTSLIIAEKLQRSHKAIVNLLKKHESSFNEFGTLSFSKLQSTGGRQTIFYYLNEQHLTFLVMNMRTKKNETDKVLCFKKEITKEFFRMRKILLEIKNQQKSQEWIEARREGKEVRRLTTDEFQEYQIYCVNSGSETYRNNPDLVYSNITRMINKELFETTIKIKPNSDKSLRDYMSKEQLNFMKAAEITAKRIISESMKKKVEYHEIYKETKKQIKIFAGLIGKTVIGNPIDQYQQISLLT